MPTLTGCTPRATRGISRTTRRRMAAGITAFTVLSITGVVTPAVAGPDTSPAATDAAASSVPEPDIVSSDFTSEGPVEHTRDRTVTTDGVAPSIGYDAPVQPQAATVAAEEDRTRHDAGR